MGGSAWCMPPRYGATESVCLQSKRGPNAVQGRKGLYTTMAELTFFIDWKYCSACGLPAGQIAKLMTCAGCGCAAYHNTNCQRSHWRIHKHECKELAGAILPLRELVRWHTTHEKFKKDVGDNESSVVASGGRVRCWWEPSDGNGMTEDKLVASDDLWGRNVRRWQNTDYLGAFEGFKKSLEPYNKAWSHMNESNGARELRDDDNMDAFLHNSLVLANRLLFCAYCEMDGSQVESGRRKLVQCISITISLFFTYPLTSSHDSIRVIMNDAWMELMLRLVV
jgi:hypothetical protein